MEDASLGGKNSVMALKALYSLFLCISLESQLDELIPLVETILVSLNLQLQLANEELLTSFVQIMIDLAEEKPSFFGGRLDRFFNAIITLLEGSQPTIPDSVVYLFVELLVVLCTGIPKKCRKLKGPAGEKNYFASRFLPVCLRLMSEVAQDDVWAAKDSVETADEKSTASDVGESALNRSCIALGVSATYAVISTIIAPYLVSHIWQHQYAGLQCIANYLEVSVALSDRNQLNVHRMEVYSTLAHFIKSPIAQVKAAAYFAFSQLVMCHGSDLKKDQLDALLRLMSEGVSVNANASPRVRRSCLIVLINFIEIASASYMERNADFLLRHFVTALTDGPKIVQESAISGIIAMAETMHGSRIWKVQYQPIMTVLKQLMVSSHSYEADSIWAQALECSAVVGECAGKELFFDDAVHMMNALIGLQGGGGDLSVSKEHTVEMFVMKVWVRIA
jgi:hypothetical protein